MAVDEQPVKFPRGQVALNHRASRVMALPRTIKWRDDLDSAEIALIRRAGLALPVLKKNLPRLEAALERAEGAYRKPLKEAVAAVATQSPAPVVMDITERPDPLEAIEAMLQAVPDAAVHWRDLRITKHLEF